MAFERGVPWIRALLERPAAMGVKVVVPTSALAQVWRGGPRSASLAMLIAAAVSDSLDESRAREVGERLGICNASDIADAHVVCCALEHGAAVVTSDSTDMEALAAPHECLTLIPV